VAFPDRKMKWVRLAGRKGQGIFRKDSGSRSLENRERVGGWNSGKQKAPLPVGSRAAGNPRIYAADQALFSLNLLPLGAGLPAKVIA
jgi:hypothetical protein